MKLATISCFTSQLSFSQARDCGAAYARFPILCISPEGTTKRSECLLTFSTGAFVGGRPVLPVLLHYRHRCIL